MSTKCEVNNLIISNLERIKELNKIINSDKSHVYSKVIFEQLKSKIMNNAELKSIERNMFCPECESEDIKCFFEKDGIEVSHLFVNPDYFSSDYCHVGYCRNCEFEDVREYFDSDLKKEVKEHLRNQRNTMTLPELDSLKY